MGHTFGFRSITLEGMHQFHLEEKGPASLNTGQVR